MRAWVSLLGLLTGCDGILHLERVPDPKLDGGPDAPVDAALDAPLPAELMHFNFNDNLRDQVSNQSAICTSCPMYTAGVHGNAALFGGSDCVNFTPVPKLTTFTVAVWVMDATDTSYALVGVPYMSASTNFDTWQLDTDSPNFVVRFWTYGAGSNYVTDLNALTMNEWHHVALTFDSTGQKSIYIDGVLHQTVNQPGITYDAVPVLYMGCDRDSGTITHNFSGALDDLYVYDRALTAAEVAYLKSQ